MGELVSSSCQSIFGIVTATAYLCPRPPPITLPSQRRPSDRPSEPSSTVLWQTGTSISIECGAANYRSGQHYSDHCPVRPLAVADAVCPAAIHCDTRHTVANTITGCAHLASHLQLTLWATATLSPCTPLCTQVNDVLSMCLPFALLLPFRWTMAGMTRTSRPTAA